MAVLMGKKVNMDLFRMRSRRVERAAMEPDRGEREEAPRAVRYKGPVSMVSEVLRGRAAAQLLIPTGAVLAEKELGAVEKGAAAVAAGSAVVVAAVPALP